MHSQGITEILVTGDRHDLVTVVFGHWRPNAVVAWGEPYDSPLWRDRPAGFAYVCRNFACQLPVSDAPELISLLQKT